MNKFDQFVEDLVSGELSLTQDQIAIRASIRRRKDIPDCVKGLLAGEEGIGGINAGLIYRMFEPIQHMIGTVELAYRRGSQKDG